MSDKALHVLAGGLAVGRITEVRGKHEFEYDGSWVDRGPNAFPISLSMPMQVLRYKGEIITNWLWNLLPDNEVTLGSWAKEFQCSARNPFSLLAYTGEDCPGAIQIVRGDRLDAVRQDGVVRWLTECDVAERLRALRVNGGGTGRVGKEGQFSLAGAQPKTAFLYQDGKWGVPEGRLPTTHIFKPPSASFEGLVQNEHISLCLAKALGMRVAKSEILNFGDEVAIVVERFDRIRRDDRILRLHQEDMCQAMGVGPGQKYENDRGPGAKRIVMEVLRRCDDFSEARQQFFQALLFSLAIGATDQHAKNYSVQIVPGPKVRLAPIYDVASYLPHADELRNARLAMKIGGKYGVQDIMPRHLEWEASSCGIHPDEAFGWFRAMIEQIPDLLATVIREARDKGLDHAIFVPMQERVAVNCDRLSRLYGKTGEALPRAAAEETLPASARLIGG